MKSINYLIMFGILFGLSNRAFAESQPAYWQQDVDYNITATLDPNNKRLSGVATVEYTNNSNQPLDKLVFELPQQLYRQLNISYQGRKAGSSELLAFDKNEQQLPVNERATLFDVKLAQPLLPNASTKIKLKWQLQFIPRNHTSSPRGGFESFNDGSLIIGASEWYPRILAFDHQLGWDNLPFKGKGEFHQEFSSYTITLKVPNDFIVAASGELLNSTQVFTDEQSTLLQRQNVKQQIPTLTSETTKGYKSWRFKAEQQRDFTFAIGNNLVWESKTIQLSKGLTQLNVFYPNNGRWLWQKYGLDAIEHSVKFLDANLAPFPVKHMTLVNIAGIGMEYSGFTFVGFRGPDSIDGRKPIFSRTQKYDVIGGTIHEVTHNYFPMLVNSNERREGFYDEGLASYLSYLIEQAWSPDFQSFYGAPKSVIPVMQSPFSRPAELADKLRSKLDSHYHVPAAAWNILAKQIIGEQTLLTLLNQFIVQNSHKRTYFSDLTKFINQHTKVELSEFFDDWFYSNQHVDLTVKSVSTKSTGLEIIVENIGGIEMPFDVVIVLENGEIKRLTVPYSDWQAQFDGKLLLSLQTQLAVLKVEVDPSQQSADINRDNNVWLPTFQ